MLYLMLPILRISFNLPFRIFHPPKFFTMKKFCFFLLLIPLFTVAQTPSVVVVNRFFPKMDKVAEFESALKAHAAKYHTGTWKWRVYSIQSGQDFGGYHIVEGPVTWDQVDKRGDLGDEHMNDLYKNLLPLLEKGTQNFSVYREDLSSIALTDFTDKIAITHVYPRVGKYSQIEDNIKLLRKMWQDSKQNIAVYESSHSGPPQFTIVTRYKEGLKERERGFMKPAKERYEASHGANTYDKVLASIGDGTESQWSEMLFFVADLSSK